MTASFHEIQFPAAISYGAVGGPAFKTTVLTLASGYEQRNIDWSKTKGSWDVAYGLKKQDELEEIRAFFMARYGKAYGFRFKDWMDFVLMRQSIGTTDSTTATWQIYKRYQDTASYFDRDITKPVAGTLNVWVNDVPIMPGSSATEYEIDTTTGIITLGATLTATTGHSIDAQSEFDVPVRFDTDHLATSIVDYNVFTWGQINLVEVRI